MTTDVQILSSQQWLKCRLKPSLAHAAAVHNLLKIARTYTRIGTKHNGIWSQYDLAAADLRMLACCRQGRGTGGLLWIPHGRTATVQAKLRLGQGLL